MTRLNGVCGRKAEWRELAETGRRLWSRYGGKLPLREALLPSGGENKAGQLYLPAGPLGVSE